jgi:hypothetical protein
MNAQFETDEIRNNTGAFDWLPDVISSSLRPLVMLIIPACSISWRIGNAGIGPFWLPAVGRTCLIVSVTVTVMLLTFGMILFQSWKKSTTQLWFCAPTWLPVSVAALFAWIYVTYNWASWLCAQG